METHNRGMRCCSMWAKAGKKYHTKLARFGEEAGRLPGTKGFVGDPGLFARELSLAGAKIRII